MLNTHNNPENITASNDLWSNELASSQIQKRLADIHQAKNPLLEAARPLLRAMSDMRLKAVEGDMESFRDMLVREVKVFQYLSEQAGIKKEHILATRYCLCTGLDEVASHSNWVGGPEAWATNSLLVTFHNETYGGEKFFQLLGRLAQSPDEHADVLEVMYQIMGLGFEGRYRPMSDGHRQLETIRHRVRTILSNRQGERDYMLSPHWQGEKGGRMAVFRSIPVWVTAAVLSLFLFALFGMYKYYLMSQTRDLEAKINKLNEVNAVVVQPAVTLRLAELLKGEIARGVVKVSEDERQSVVTFTGDNMFMPGQAEVNNNIKPTLDKVASEINRVTGRVSVIGHSDNSPIKTEAFPNNQALSEKRAQSVADYLSSASVLSSRITVEGKGDTVPVVSNNTAAGKAKNRRVEIIVTQ
jgi:type VI secretion system protein ImpK